MVARVQPRETNVVSESAVDLARSYLRRGWQPVPIDRGQKRPRDNAWQSLALTDTNVEEYFRNDDNVGVQLGARSSGLTDVDIDCAEALDLADQILPATGAIFGRGSKPKSHRLYITDLSSTEQKATVRFAEPPALSNGREPATLVELRVGGGDKGAQTVAPGFVHPSGEKVRWDDEREPSSVSGSDLKKAVSLLSVAALLVRHYPAGAGNRHERALVLGGVLARGPALSADEIKKIVSAVARCAGDEEAEERGNSAAGAVELLAQGSPTPGLRRMREVWGDDLTDTITKWLKLEDEIGDAEIDRLARLDGLAYERERRQAARQLGSRESALDKLVDRRRRELQQNGSGQFLAPVEVWPEPVDANGLLNDLCDVFDRHVVLPRGGSLACALWTLHAHTHNAAAHSPILDISSPTKRCGKTQLLQTVSLLVPKSLSAANVTAATVFRAINFWGPTLLIDEVDTFLADRSDLRGVLNSGHTKSSAYVLRCVGDDSVPQQFSTWCPKVFAHIGRVDPTLEDRSVRITLRRRLKTETIERIPSGDPYADLRRKCARWAADKFALLEEAEPSIPNSLNDRAVDNWRPLLAIAEACGCGEEARGAALELSEIDDDETDAIVLFGDLADLFDNEKRSDSSSVSMTSAEIVRSLATMEDRKWPEYRGGKSITPAQLASLLKPFKIYPRKVSDRDRQAQGYRFDQFGSTFKRYLAD